MAVLAAIVSVQVGAAFAKSLFPMIGAAGMTTLRTSLGAVMLLVICRPWRGGLPPWRRLPVIFAYGASLGAMNAFFYLAIRTLPLGVAVAIELIGPFALVLVMTRRTRDLLWVALAAVGLLALLPKDALGRPVDPLGACFALVAGVCWAFYIVFGHKTSSILPAGRAAGAGLLVAAMVTLPFGARHAASALLDPRLLGMALGVALLSSALPYFLETIALKRLPPRTFGVLMSLEPAMAALAGMALLGERLSLPQEMAIGAIVVASIGSTLSAQRARARAR